MATITISIPNDKATRIVNAFKYFWPIPKVPDPLWISNNPGEPIENAPLVNEYSDSDWVKQKTIERYKEQTIRYETAIAKKAVDDAASFDVSDIT